MEGPIDFDGKPDEAAWDHLEPFPLVTHMPVFGNPPSERSVIRMGYDDQYIYVGALMFVSDPSYIRALGKKRDMETMSSDFFLLGFDTYNDKENALMFATNPLSLRWDAAVSNDGTIVMEDKAAALMDNPEIKAAYFGV